MRYSIIGLHAPGRISQPQALYHCQNNIGPAFETWEQVFSEFLSSVDRKNSTAYVFFQAARTFLEFLTKLWPQ